MVIMYVSSLRYNGIFQLQRSPSCASSIVFQWLEQKSISPDLAQFSL